MSKVSASDSMCRNELTIINDTAVTARNACCRSRETLKRGSDVSLPVPSRRFAHDTTT